MYELVDAIWCLGTLIVGAIITQLFIQRNRKKAEDKKRDTFLKYQKENDKNHPLLPFVYPKMKRRKRRSPSAPPPEE